MIVSGASLDLLHPRLARLSLDDFVVHDPVI